MKMYNTFWLHLPMVTSCLITFLLHVAVCFWIRANLMSIYFTAVIKLQFHGVKELRSQEIVWNWVNPSLFVIIETIIK